MPWGLIFRLPRRRAVSMLVGGVIVLSLLLTALATVVFVSQQYAQYQQTADQMAQYSDQQWSENLVAISPGLAIVTTATISGWGSGCGTTYNCYNATISNLGDVGVQITRIYINSTGPSGSGCSSPNPQPCILNPTRTIAAYTFNQANGFLNPGEVNHAVLLALPAASPTVLLPNPNPGFPQNTIAIATARGNMFSFQWPFQVSTFGQSQSAFSSGNIKVAYQGTYDSSNEYHGASGNTSPNGPYCHNETLQNYPAGIGYAEKLTGITGATGNTLYFVNPWITSTVMNSANSGGTTVYIYVIVINTGNSAYSVVSGTIDLTWYGSNHLDGPLIGIYYNGQFYATSPSIGPGMAYYAIFKLTIFTMGNDPWNVQSGNPSAMLWGAASITNALSSGGGAEDQSYFSGTILLSGLWIRYEPSSGSCA